MKPKEKTYKFKLYEEDLSNELLIQQIRKAISTLPVVCFSSIIVDLFDLHINKPGIPFFQTTHVREFQKTKLYTFEIRLNLESQNKLIWKIYRKTNQTKKQVLQAFEEICVKRILPDLSDWEESDISSENTNPKNKNVKLLKNTLYNYYPTDLTTEIDYIRYLESLRYFIDNCDNYIADKWILLADQHCVNGQYEAAKAIYEMVTFAPSATFELANMIMSGKLGKPNYKLAYEYYKHTCLIDEINYFVAKIKIAKMHRDGKYFKPDYQTYKKSMKSIEREYLKSGRIYPCLDELYYELALIEKNDGNIEQAIIYCFKARHWAIQYLTYDGNKESIITATKIFKLLYSLTEFDVASANAFDLLYLLNAPLKVIIVYENTSYEIESFYDKEYLIIKFDKKYFRSAMDFFLKAALGGHRILHEAEKITILEVIK